VWTKGTLGVGWMSARLKVEIKEVKRNIRRKMLPEMLPPVSMERGREDILPDRYKHRKLTLLI